MAKVMTRESLAREVEANPVAQKYARRIGLLESARKAVGAKPMSTFEKYYDAEVITSSVNYKLQTTNVLILDDPKFKGRIIRGKGWLHEL